MGHLLRVKAERESEERCEDSSRLQLFISVKDRWKGIDQKNATYLAASPVAPFGSPATFCKKLRLPSTATDKAVMLSSPALSTYKNFELVLSAASMGEMVFILAAMACKTVKDPSLAARKE